MMESQRSIVLLDPELYTHAAAGDTMASEDMLTGLQLLARLADQRARERGDAHRELLTPGDVD